MKKKITFRQSLAETYASLSPYLSVGWVFFVSVSVTIALGWWLDKKLSTLPVFLIFGALLGIAVGIYNMIIILREIKDKEGTEQPSDDQ